MANSISSHYATPMASTSSTASSSSASSSTAGDLGSTFLNLLSQELMHQDPTAPMDSTAMVGQMISLNQLQQLISIKQTLGEFTGSSTSSSSSTTDSTTATADSSKTKAQTIAAQNASALDAAATSQGSSFSPSNLISTGGDYASALAAAVNSSRNLQSSNLMNAISNIAGGR